MNEFELYDNEFTPQAEAVGIALINTLIQGLKASHPEWGDLREFYANLLTERLVYGADDGIGVINDFVEALDNWQEVYAALGAADTASREAMGHAVIHRILES